MQLKLFYAHVVASPFPGVTLNLSRLPWLPRALASWPVAVVTRVSAPAIPLWEERDGDVDSSCSAIRLVSLSHACWNLFTLLLSLHPSAAPGNTLICCISYLSLVWEISFLSLLPPKSLLLRCRSAFL